jgi:hypothetical protein
MSIIKRSLPDTVRVLFGVDPSECTLLKDRANSFARNGLVKIIEEPVEFGHRNKKYLAEGQDVVLFNALVLNAIFHDPKYVKKIFTDKAFRKQTVETLKAVLLGQANLSGIALSSPECVNLVSAVEGESDLYADKLPNPFSVLPQAALGKNTNLLQALLAQSAALEPMDSILMAYLSGDIELAYSKVQGLSDEQSLALPLISRIKQAYQEANEFDDLLDQMRQL